MADGGRARSGMTSDDAAHVERAARRVARMYGYGSGWRASVTHHAADDENVGAERLGVAHRGYVSEQAARLLADATTSVRRQHVWTHHPGVVAVPNSNPHTEGMAAVSFAQFSGPELPLLRTYACESLEQWEKVEPFLWAAAPSKNQRIAGRDAISRIIYGRALATRMVKGVLSMSIEARARELRMNTQAYRMETRNAQAVLERWLINAAKRLNKCANWQPAPLGASQGNAHRVETWWHPERPLNKDATTVCRRHKK